MNLSKENIDRIEAKPGLYKPTLASFSLPEKILQFGTGMLLRGLPDYYVDKANRQGVFNGRIVVVKSTGNGGTDAFQQQDCLYTHTIKGIENGEQVDELIINSSISRVLSAQTDWNAILDTAANPEVQVVFSNTTEIGISLDVLDKVTSNPPSSFPGKLLAWLWKRYQVFSGSIESGVVIVPSELIPENGTRLKQICVDLAKHNHLDVHFIKWLQTANDFCNSLVDRIVSGNEKAHMNGEENSDVIGDALAIVSEPYSLWAIETSSERTRKLLSFAKADENIILAENIERYRELKLRLLNGAHTFTCGLAILSGFKTVKEAMENKFFENFLENLMHNEISKAILSKDIKEVDTRDFTEKVLDRFRNPFIDHLWVSITKQYTSKMLMRNIPSLLAYYQRHNKTPQHMAIGFCSYILFMHSEELEIGKFSGKINGEYTLIQDAKASILNEKWDKSNLKETVREILSDSDLWHTDLTQLPGFEKTVYEYVIKFMDQMALQPQSIVA